MLEHYYRLAARMRSLQRLLWTVAALAVAAFGIALVPVYRGAGYGYALAPVLVLLWTLWLISVANSFTSAPPTLDPNAPLIARTKVRMKRAWLWALAIVMTGLLGFVVLISIRAVGVTLRG
jgi:hypothetical protein